MSDTTLQKMAELYSSFQNIPPQFRTKDQLHKLLSAGFAFPGSAGKDSKLHPSVDQNRMETPRLKSDQNFQPQKNVPGAEAPEHCINSTSATPSNIGSSDSISRHGLSRVSSAEAVCYAAQSESHETVAYVGTSPGDVQSKPAPASHSKTDDEADSQFRTQGPELQTATSRGNASKEDESSREGSKCGPINKTDMEMAQMLMSIANSTVGNPGITLQNLLDYDPQDYNDLLLAHAESNRTYTDAVACYLHNLRMVAEDSVADPESESEVQQKEIRDQYTAKISELIQFCATGVRVEKSTKASKGQQQQRAQQATQGAGGGRGGAGGRRASRQQKQQQPGRAAVSKTQQNAQHLLDDFQRQQQRPSNDRGNTSSPSIFQDGSTDQVQMFLQQLLGQGPAPAKQQPTPPIPTLESMASGPAQQPNFSQPNMYANSDAGMAAMLQSLLMNQSQSQQQMPPPMMGQQDMLQHLSQQNQMLQMHIMSQGLMNTDFQSFPAMGMPQVIPNQRSQQPAAMQPSLPNAQLYKQLAGLQLGPFDWQQ